MLTSHETYFKMGEREEGGREERRKGGRERGRGEGGREILGLEFGFFFFTRMIILFIVQTGIF